MWHADRTNAMYPMRLSNARYPEESEVQISYIKIFYFIIAHIFTVTRIIVTTKIDVYCQQFCCIILIGLQHSWQPTILNKGLSVDKTDERHLSYPLAQLFKIQEYIKALSIQVCYSYRFARAKCITKYQAWYKASDTWISDDPVNR